VGPTVRTWQLAGGPDQADVAFIVPAHSKLNWRLHAGEIEIPRKLRNKIKWNQIFEMAEYL
jgi:hypothetical protein